MAYTKKVWKNGDDVTEHDLNRIEIGIEGLDVAMNTRLDKAEADIESHATTISQHEDKIGSLSTDKADKNNGAFTGTMTLNGSKIATTTKTEVLCTENTGYIIERDLSCIINNVVYLNVLVRKTDNTIISNGPHHMINMPFKGKEYNTLSTFTLTHDDVFGNGEFKAFSHSDGKIYGHMRNNTDATKVYIGGVVVV